MLAKAFMQRFRGLERAHGTYEVTEARPAGEKQTGIAVTRQQPVTEALWADHLSGKARIGIVPINDDNDCNFGAIDVDVYEGLDLSGRAKRVAELGLPLVVCRSKSGGMHAYLFSAEPVPASLMQARLMEFAAMLGHGGCEVFPKQVKILAGRGDIGNWINMPYFQGEETVCYALNPHGRRLTMEDFLAYSASVQVTRKWLEEYAPGDVPDFEEGPPCLQVLARITISEGGRNDGLFNVAVYLRKAHPDNWQAMLIDYNRKYCEPSLSGEEVRKLVESVSRKDYGYTCNRPPIKSHCHKSVCRTKKFGVGKAQGELPTLTGLAKYDSRPPLWFVDVDGGGRLELSTEDLQQPDRFQRRCMDVLNAMPPIMKREDWQRIVTSLLGKVTIIEAPADATPEGRFMDLLEKFCTSRTQARVRDEILLGKPWTHEKRHYFRMQDLLNFLDNQRFRDLGPHRIASLLKDKGADHHFFNLKGRGVNCWAVEQFPEQQSGHEIPNLGGGDAF